MAVAQNTMGRCCRNPPPSDAADLAALEQKTLNRRRRMLCSIGEEYLVAMKLSRSGAKYIATAAQNAWIACSRILCGAFGKW